MAAQLEADIAEWRDLVGQGRPLDTQDVDELESHLRDQILDLQSAGLTDDEAFLVAVKRIGNMDAVSREFAREHSGLLWKQLVVSGDNADGESAKWAFGLALAVGAAVAVEVARLAAGDSYDGPNWLPRNLGLLVLPFLAAFFARRREMRPGPAVLLALPFAAAALVVNLYPFEADSWTEALIVVHLPVVLWAVVGLAYMGGSWRSHERRMDFVRFTGEWSIYYVLIALGGGLFVGLTGAILDPVVSNFYEVIPWIVLAGAAGAVLVAAMLVEWKQGIVENMAPVLTMIFTPLFAVMLAVAAVVYAVTGLGDVFQRDMIGSFDGLMTVVLGLVLYGLSARDPQAEAGWMDRIRLFAVISALALDVVVLWAMIARIGSLGFTANRTAALGLNVLLLANLAGTAVFYGRFLAGRGTYHQVERWQTSYLPVFAVWAATVVVVLPPLFHFA